MSALPPPAHGLTEAVFASWRTESYDLGDARVILTLDSSIDVGFGVEIEWALRGGSDADSFATKAEAFAWAKRKILARRAAATAVSP